MSWWQKKLLRYTLSHTGLLDDAALNLDGLDITLGRRNVVELKDVGLNIKRISKLAQLPPALRVKTARVLSLRLTVPADIYQSGIVAEIDGVELGARLVHEHVKKSTAEKEEERREGNGRSPQHRKVHRRIQSPPPSFDIDDGEEDAGAHLPTTEELARSFLVHEDAQERRQLEASVALNAKGMEESFASGSSESEEMGMGAAVGLPGFLASFLQGVADRLQISVKNIVVTLDTELGDDSADTIPVTLRLKVGSAGLAPVGPGMEVNGRREFKLDDISVDLLSDTGVFASLSEPTSPTSPTSPVLSRRSATASSPPMSPSKASARLSKSSEGSVDAAPSSPRTPEVVKMSTPTVDLDRFADADDGVDQDGFAASTEDSHADFGIQPGDDNISWGSRKSKASLPANDLWKSMVSEDDLPESLLLQRASTPRAHSSRGHSPDLSRTRRNVSPYSRRLQSPGSWPTLEDHTDRYTMQPSPGSWPNLDQSHHSMFQSLTQTYEAPVADANAAHRATQESVTLPMPALERQSSSPDSAAEDMTASRIYSHEEARSMYMSAMSHGPSMQIPGGWGSEYSSSEHSQPGNPVDQVINPPHGLEPAPSIGRHQQPPPNWENELAYGERPYTTPKAPLSGNVTPRGPSPSPAKVFEATPDAPRRASKQLVTIDTLTLLVPSKGVPAGTVQQHDTRGTREMRDNSKINMPGTFSMYSDLSASRNLASSTATTRGYDPRGSMATNTAPAAAAPPALPTEINVGNIRLQVDVPSSKLLYRAVLTLQEVLQPPRPQQSGRPTSSIHDTASSALPPISVSVEGLSLALVESLGADFEPGMTGTAVVSLACQDIDVALRSDEKEVFIGSLKVSIGASCLLSFDRTLAQSISVVLTDRTPDVALTLSSKYSVTQRQVSELAIETLPVKVWIDLPAIDEAFSGFGGISGVLEAGNSILSESGLGSKSPAPVKPAKGVRFETKPAPVNRGTEVKVNARLGGLFGTLQGSSCNVQLRASTVKAVYREAGAVATIEHVLASGPHLNSDEVSPISAELTTLRLEYLLSPQDKDLERLLSLLTPSNDKYDNDEDILLETLFRQRKKGAIARVAVGGVRLKCNDWACLDTLSSLGAEMSRLSAVTQYLPEDDRPGVMVLVRLKDCEARLPVNEKFGQIHVRLGDVHLAQVGLPALLALSIGSVHISQGGKVELLHPLVSVANTDNLPMIMARMVGNEVEPMVKIKLYNVGVEYSVPILLDLTGVDPNADPNDLVSELSKSVANFVVGPSPSPERPSNASDTSEMRAKTTKLVLLVHDSALGLSPQKLSSKGLLVLTDAWFSTVVPPQKTLTAKLEVRKAGLFVADHVLDEDLAGAVSARGAPSNTAVTPKLISILPRQGFVSVGSIMAAKISVLVTEVAEGEHKSIDVDVTNELFLLETCADSTQTLIAVMNGLAPPTPPSKQRKYLTEPEPMAIEDMMASFTGEPVAKPEQAPQTLFDVEEESEDEPETMLGLTDFDEGEDDGLLAESEMTSSLYGPVSGILGGVDQPDDEEGSEEYPGTAESLLEDDPFEMTTAPADTRLSDSALVRELSKQCNPVAKNQPVDLGNYEIEDLGYDALGCNQTALGSRYRFNTPAGNPSKQARIAMQHSFPFKLRLRDLHIIWNLYDGYDWQRTREGITEAVERVERKTEQRKAKRRTSRAPEEEEESVIGDFLFNSIYIGVPSNLDALDIRRQINRNIDDLASETESVPVSGMSRPSTYSASPRSRPPRRLKLERSRAHKIAFELKGVSADVLVFPSVSPDIVNSVDVRVRDFEIFDNIPTSTWRKFLTHLEQGHDGREMAKPMMHVELFNVRTLENYAASEIAMHVSVLPLRLHVDQDALDFITRFFEFKDDSATPPDASGEQPFIQRLEVDTVDLCLDYKPKTVDYASIRSGHTNEFMNFVNLDAANIRLKHTIIYGIRGFEPLHKTLNDIWMPDVKRNQLPTVLAGLAPVRSLVNIGSGVRDVVAIPIREYKKDGRIVRSIQKGAFQFGKTTASELARLGAKVAIGTQNLLQGAEGMLSPASAASSARPRPLRGSPSDHGWQDIQEEEEEPERRAISAYANQPLSVFGGLRSARRYLEQDLLTARDALIAVQGEVMDSTTPGGAAAAVARHAPTVILRPIIGTSRAVGTALLGVGNAIDRDNVRRVDDKYKRR